jgi:predicted transcriptional regulator
MNLQSDSEPDFWEELNEAQKAQVELAIQQLDAGDGIPHEEVMERLRKKYITSS